MTPDPTTPPATPAGQDEYRAALRRAIDAWRILDHDWMGSDGPTLVDAIVAVPHPEVAELNQLRAARTVFDQRLSDLQTEMGKHAESWGRQRALLTSERDTARAELAALRASTVAPPRAYVIDALNTAVHHGHYHTEGYDVATAADELLAWRAPTVGDTAPPATETQTGHPGNCGTCGRTLSLSTPIRTDSARYCSITCWETANPPEEMHAPSDYERENCGRCYRCLRPTFGPMGPDRMILCPYCGNKRCPNATDHHNPCTHSNEPGQPGSRYLALLGFTEVERSPAKPPEEPRDGQ